MTTAVAPLHDLSQRLPPTAATRYHAFDFARALAMFLGIFYHWQFVAGSGGFMATGPKASVDHWLHSFRMALFFLISGFFANMMLAKYGPWKYLWRRWWRIGMPLLVSLFAFAGLQFVQAYYPWASPFASFGPVANTPAPAAPNFGGGGTAGFGAGPGQGLGGRPAQNFGGQNIQGGRGPGFGASGFGQSPSGGAPAKAVATPVPIFNIFSFGAPPHPWADWIFSKIHLSATRSDGQPVAVAAGNFMLQHLWFLWYLLIFCTIAPALTRSLGFFLVRSQNPLTDRFGTVLLRWNLLPVALALITLPALLLAPGAGWSLTNPAGFLGTFPDIFHQYFIDLPFYFLYFLFGWWFYRLRANLGAIAKPWLFNFCLGVTAFALSQSLYDHYGPPPMPFWRAVAPAAASPAPSVFVRLLAFGLYALGAAYSGFGLLGLFQKYLDRPTKVARYFTDTMLWVYLVQLALIPYLASWVDYNHTSWWEATMGGVLLVTAVALALFEIFVRPTPLVHIFGPASLTKNTNARRPTDG
jgi:hypothetical protein